MLSFGIEDKGILPDRMIAALAADGAILSENKFVPDQIQPASLDLRLGEVAYRVRASFLPGSTTVARRIDELKLHEISLSDGAVLETGCVYIVPLQESLALPEEISGAANPKSSTGRLDVFTRVIADGTRRLSSRATPSELRLPHAAAVSEGLLVTAPRLDEDSLPSADYAGGAARVRSPLPGSDVTRGSRDWAGQP